MGEIERDERIVCVATGHLLKDPERVIEICEVPREVEADVEVLRKMLRSFKDPLPSLFLSLLS